MLPLRARVKRSQFPVPVMSLVMFQPPGYVKVLRRPDSLARHRFAWSGLSSAPSGLRWRAAGNRLPVPYWRRPPRREMKDAAVGADAVGSSPDLQNRAPVAENCSWDYRQLTQLKKLLPASLRRIAR